MIRLTFDESVDGAPFWTPDSSLPTSAGWGPGSDYAMGQAYGRDGALAPWAPIVGDFAFRTYVDSIPPSPAPIPEPSSLVLLGTGLAAVAYRRRRQRSS